MSAFRTDLLFWVFLIIAAGFARYFVLAVNEDDRPFAVAAAVAFVLMCVVAAAEFFGWWWCALQRPGTAYGPPSAD